MTGRSAHGPRRPYDVIETMTSPGSRARSPECVEHGRRESFEHDVSRRDEVEDLGIVGCADDRSRAVVEEAEQRATFLGVDGRAAGRPPAQRITVGWLHLHDVGARFREQVRAVRARDPGGEVDDSQVREPGQSFRHARKKSSRRGFQCALTDGSIVQPCGPVRVEQHLGVVPRQLPARGHEHRVVDEMVGGAGGEQRGRHPGEVGVQR